MLPHAEIGELRDIGVLADLLAMPGLPDEVPGERTVLADVMERLAACLQESRSALGNATGKSEARLTTDL